MRLKIWALATLAAFATVSTARADLFFEFIKVTAVNVGENAGPAINNITVASGTTFFIQVALHDTGGTNLGNGHVAFDAAYPGLFGAGFKFDYFQNALVNPAPPGGPGGAANANLRLVTDRIDPSDPVYTTFTTNNPPPFTTFGNTGISTSHPATDGFAPDPTTGRIGIFNVRFVAMAAGSYDIVLQDPGAGTDVGLVDPSSPGGNTPFSVDSIVFSAAHTAAHTLHVVVTGVPEPSSMVLAGVALTGLGVRLRRKKAAAATAV